MHTIFSSCSYKTILYQPAFYVNMYFKILTCVTSLIQPLKAIVIYPALLLVIAYLSFFGF